MPSANYVQGMKDLYERYATTFAAAWRGRKELDGLGFTQQEAEFLPAALAVQESPLSPAPRIATLVISLLIVLAMAWSYFGQLDMVAVAPGKVVPSEGSKIIQPLETAVITKIHVHEGQLVRESQPLIDLDWTDSKSDMGRHESDFLFLRLQEERALAMMESIATSKYVPLKVFDGVSDDQLRDANRHLEGQYAEYVSKLTRFEADTSLKLAEGKSTREVIGKLELTVPIAQQRANDYRALLAQDFVSKHGLLEREQARIEQEGELATQRRKLEELQLSVAQIGRQKEAFIAEMKRIAIDSLTDARQKLPSVNADLTKASSRLGTRRLISPVDGTVQQLAVRTVGGVVTPAQPLMTIVPSNHPIEAEIQVSNRDIGFVRSGQEVQVKVETFQFTKYGLVAGRILSLSRDAVEDKTNGLVFTARIALEKRALNINGAEVALTPGMAITAEVKMGTQRIIEYLWKPVQENVHNSLRER